MNKMLNKYNIIEIYSVSYSYKPKWNLIWKED